MTQQTVGRIVRATAITAFVTAGASWILAWAEWRGMRSPALGMTANVIMVVILGIQAFFLVMQMLPNGRTVIPLVTTTDDGWSLALVGALLAGVAWDNLGRLAGPPMSQVLPGFPSPTFNCTLLLLGRAYQLRDRARGGRLHQG